MAWWKILPMPPAATCALGDFAYALGGTDAEGLSSDACTVADVAGGSGGGGGGGE
jgi:hypothetical protein